MSRSWLQERVETVVNGFHHLEASRSRKNCSEFMRGFEARLNEQLFLNKFDKDNRLYLPIQKGCFPEAAKMLKANNVLSPSYQPYHTECECAVLTLDGSNLYFIPFPDCPK